MQARGPSSPIPVYRTNRRRTGRVAPAPTSFRRAAPALRDLWSRVFFFQAEDGIRDGTVTGVQTCALPICGRGRGLLAARAVRAGDESRAVAGGRHERDGGQQGGGAQGARTGACQRGRHATDRKSVV